MNPFILLGLLFVMLHLCTYCYDHAARFISQVVVFIGIYILLLLFTVTLMLLNDLLAVQIGVWDQFRCRFFIHWFVKKIAVLFDDVYIWNAFDVVCWTWSKLIFFFMLCKMGASMDENLISVYSYTSSWSWASRRCHRL